MKHFFCLSILFIVAQYSAAGRSDDASTNLYEVPRAKFSVPLTENACAQILEWPAGPIDSGELSEVLKKIRDELKTIKVFSFRLGTEAGGTVILKHLVNWDPLVPEPSIDNVAATLREVRVCDREPEIKSLRPAGSPRAAFCLAEMEARYGLALILSHGIFRFLAASLNLVTPEIVPIPVALAIIAVPGLFQSYFAFSMVTQPIAVLSEYLGALRSPLAINPSLHRIKLLASVNGSVKRLQKTLGPGEVAVIAIVTNGYGSRFQKTAFDHFANVKDFHDSLETIGFTEDQTL